MAIATSHKRNLLNVTQEIGRETSFLNKESENMQAAAKNQPITKASPFSKELLDNHIQVSESVPKLL